MRQSFIWLSLLLLCACSTHRSFEFAEVNSTWQGLFHPAHIRSTERRAGEGAVNCGAYDLRIPEEREQLKKKGILCQNQASKQKLAYRMAFVDIQGDMLVQTFIAFDPLQKRTWLVDYAVSLDGEDATASAETCARLYLQGNSVYFKRNGCQAVDLSD